MSKLTVFLARLIGLSTILVVVGVLVRGGGPVSATIHDAPLMFGYAIISLAIGIAMVLAHNVWSGGPLPVVVTIVGWLILLKGLALLLVPDSVLSVAGQMHYGANYYFYLVPALVIGLYLTLAGFFAASTKA